MVKDCVFRINKDTRFTKDKSPYKINLWLHIAPWGKKTDFPWYYLHLQNDASFFAWWVIMPSTENAYKIRNYIYQNYSEFESILKNSSFKKFYNKIEGYQPPLKKVPKWFEPDHASIKYILLKDWLVNDIKLTNETVLQNDFEEKVILYSKSLYQFNNFLYKALLK